MSEWDMGGDEVIRADGCAAQAPIPKSKWRWYGNAGHLIVGSDCRFHLCTEIAEYLVSTVGEYLPDSEVCDFLANSRGKPLEGRGDDRRYDWMKKFGYEEIGYGRKYETMVFKTKGRCESKDCGCGLPTIIPSELLSDTYNRADDATRGHHAMCDRVARGEVGRRDD
jgi:hypothetical protein